MSEHPILFSSPMIRAILAGTKTQTRRIVNPQPTLGEHGWTWPSNKCKSMVSIEEMPSLGPHGGRGDRMWVRETFSVDALTVYPCPPAWYRADFGNQWAEPDDSIHERSCAAPTGGIGLADCFACAMNGRRFKWKPSIFMPRTLSRITLEISDVRVQRLQEISEDDARAEGVRPSDAAIVLADDADGRPHEQRELSGTARGAFACLWDSINGKVRPMLDDDGTPVLDDNEKPITVTPRSWASNPWVWAYTFRRIS